MGTTNRWSLARLLKENTQEIEKHQESVLELTFYSSFNLVILNDVIYTDLQQICCNWNIMSSRWQYFEHSKQLSLTDRQEANTQISWDKVLDLTLRLNHVLGAELNS